MIASAEQVISAIGAATGAVLAGAGAFIAAWAKREATAAKKQTETGNGTTLAATVTRLEAQMAEQRPLLEWARIARAEHLLGRKAEGPSDIHRAEAVLNNPILEERES